MNCCVCCTCTRTQMPRAFSNNIATTYIYIFFCFALLHLHPWHPHSLVPQAMRLQVLRYQQGRLLHGAMQQLGAIQAANTLQTDAIEGNVAEVASCMELINSSATTVATSAGSGGQTAPIRPSEENRQSIDRLLKDFEELQVSFYCTLFVLIAHVAITTAVAIAATAITDVTVVTVSTASTYADAATAYPF